jgi:hypothetical protein
MVLTCRGCCFRRKDTRRRHLAGKPSRFTVARTRGLATGPPLEFRTVEMKDPVGARDAAPLLVG